MKILIVDDEVKILDIIEAYLIANNYVVYKAQTGNEALEKIEKYTPQLIVLDIMLPDVDGINILKKVRESNNTPIIMLTAKSDEDDILTGLHLGADDYMVKPFRPKELVARIETVLRRADPHSTESKLIFNNRELIIDPESKEVFFNNKLISMTYTEFDILFTLANTPNKIFSRSELIEKIKGFDFEGLDRSIDSHIKNIRRKLECDPKNPKYILTIHGTGYRFGYKK